MNRSQAINQISNGTRHRSHTAYPWVALLAFLVLSTACGGSDRYLSLEDYHKKETFGAVMDLPLRERTADAPEFLLRYIRELDNNPGYKNFHPDKRSLAVVRSSIASLPGYLQDALENHLLGIYFIEGLAGSGVTEWASDKDGVIYAFMLYNPRILAMDMPALLTWKENTAFTNDDHRMRIHISCGTGMEGFVYILLHESLHVYDYVHRITPYCDEGIRDYRKLGREGTDFTKGIWCGYATPCRKIWFQGKVRFYGLSGPGLLPISRAPEVYDTLSRGPFLSIYGTQSWAEDFAELGAFYHLTEVLHQPYRIDILRDGKVIRCFHPGQFPEVRARYGMLDGFYKNH